MSDTPRMDALWSECKNETDSWWAKSVWLYRKGQELESELTALKAERDFLQAKVNQLAQVGLELSEERNRYKAERDRLLKDKAILDTIEAECWDVRCVDVPTGGDDADVRWIVIEHHMSKPKEREVGYGGKTPRAAIESAARKETE